MQCVLVCMLVRIGGVGGVGKFESFFLKKKIRIGGFLFFKIGRKSNQKGQGKGMANEHTKTQAGVSDTRVQAKTL